jgi:hypothetical protein
MDRMMTTLSDVKDLGELLQGAGIDQAALTPSDGRVQLVIEGTRAMVEQPVLERAGMFKRPKMPWTKFRLTLGHITNVAITRAEQGAGDQAPLLACDAVAGGYQLTVRTPDGLQLILAADRLQGAFADAGAVIRI